jgi:hypothetical protein
MTMGLHQGGVGAGAAPGIAVAIAPPSRAAKGGRATIENFEIARIAMHAAFEAAVAKDPEKRICIRQMCRVIRSSDRDR